MRTFASISVSNIVFSVQFPAFGNNNERCIGLSRDLIAGFSADASDYMNSEEDYFKEYYGGKSTADPRLVFTLSRTF